MPAGSCPRQEELRGCVSGSLAEERAEEVLRHAESCPACRGALDALLREGDNLLGGLREAGPEVTLPSDAHLEQALRHSGGLREDTVIAAGLRGPR
jgi:hypothetical protein